MKRFAMEQLMAWKDSRRRKPLLIRGARQVGKTWLMRAFGRTGFENCAYVNFDSSPRLAEVFAGNLEVPRLLLALEAETGIHIEAEKTLLVFDEIQEVPRALTSLKYFQENAPQYAIVAAGSLMGVALHPGTSFPVGKVSFLDLYPLTYREFLSALGEERLSALLEQGDVSMVTVFRDRLMEYLRLYYYVGGMPEIVASFAESRDLTAVRENQLHLLDYYRQDFSKHAPVALVPRLNQVWESIPAQLAKENKKFIYGAVRSGGRAKAFELAIQWLVDCGLVHKVNRVEKPGMPLKAYMDTPVFKLYFSDVGLLGALSGLPAVSVIEGNRIFTEFKGALTEQYVLQELIAECGIRPFYYSTPNASGEIDFLLQGADDVIPVEVKAEENLRARSLRAFHEKYAPALSVRLSMSDYREQDWMTNIPLYWMTRMKACAHLS